MLFYKRQKKKPPASSLKRRKWGLGIPIHMRIWFIFINIDCYTLLVLNSALYINYIALAVVPYWVAKMLSFAAPTAANNYAPGMHAGDKQGGDVVGHAAPEYRSYLQAAAEMQQGIYRE